MRVSDVTTGTTVMMHIHTKLPIVIFDLQQYTVVSIDFFFIVEQCTVANIDFFSLSLSSSLKSGSTTEQALGSEMQDEEEEREQEGEWLRRRKANGRQVSLDQRCRG